MMRNTAKLDALAQIFIFPRAQFRQPEHQFSDRPSVGEFLVPDHNRTEEGFAVDPFVCKGVLGFCLPVFLSARRSENKLCGNTDQKSKCCRYDSIRRTLQDTIPGGACIRSSVRKKRYDCGCGVVLTVTKMTDRMTTDVVMCIL